MEDWIKEAMNRANKEAEVAGPISQRCFEHLDTKTPGMLDLWKSLIDEKVFRKFAIMMMEDEMQEALVELTKVFFCGGYTSAMDDIKNGKMKV